MDKDNNPVNQIVSGIKGLASAFANPAQAESSSDGATVTLRYSTSKVELEATESVLSKTVRQLFDENADELSLPASGNLGVRSDGKAVDAGSNPEPGRTYSASVARETKGS